MRLLFVSTPVSPIGAGDGGGVETTLLQLAPALRSRGHTVAVVAPADSRLPEGVPVFPVSGDAPPSAATAARSGAIVVDSGGVLELMWDEVRRVAPNYDAIVALTHDWLSYYLTPFFPIPVLHWVTLPSSIDAVDAEIARQYHRSPDSFAFVSRTQAATFPFVNSASARIVPGAVDLDRFPFRSAAEPSLIWAARISPEKGLEDAVQAAYETGLPLHVCGKIQDEDYWRRVCNSASAGTIVYHGLVSHGRLAELMGGAAAMLVTPKWVEAFGLTVIEALACGTPVIAYDVGGPSEIIEHGRSGFVVERNNVAAIADAIRRVARLQREDARQRAEQYSVARMAENIEQWAESAVALPAACGASR